MFPEKMVKVRIFGINEVYDRVISFLGKLSLLHVSDVKGDERLSRASIQDFKVVENKVKVILSIFKGFEFGRPLHVISYEDFVSLVNKMYSMLERFIEKEKRVRDLKNKVESLKESLKELMVIKALFGNVKKGKFYNVYIGAIPVKEIAKFKALVDDKGKIFFSSGKRGYYYVVVFSQEDVSYLFNKFGGYLIEDFSNADSLEEVIRNVEKEIELYNKEVSNYEHEKKAFFSKYKEKLAEINFFYHLFSKRKEVENLFRKTKRGFVIEGWLPSRKLEFLVEKLKEKFDGRVFVDVLGEDENPPTMLRENSFVKPFHDIMKLVGLPKYREVDAGFLYLFTLPFLYGMIIGDVIYSIISIFVSLYMRKLFKAGLGRVVADLWFYSSIFGVFWGLVYDEWAGSSHSFWLSMLREFGLNVPEKVYEGFSRIHHFEELLYLTIMLGGIYLLMGYLFAIYNSYLQRDKEHLISNVLWFGTLFFVYLFLLNYLNVVSFDILFVMIGFVLFLLGLLIREGFIAVMEIPSLFSNIISFARIAAAGIVGALIGELINEILANSIASGIISILLIPILILLHFINAVVAMAEGIIQGGRLNLVEFGTKFFSGKGYEYKPFSLKGGKDGS